ncbi:MAG TPA: hypothetical protein VGD91_29030 [Trebonia sp.]
MAVLFQAASWEPVSFRTSAPACADAAAGATLPLAPGEDGQTA